MDVNTNVICTVEGCTNKRSNAGYGRLRAICEKHRHERAGMDYQKGSKAAKSKLRDIREDLEALAHIADKQGIEAVKEMIEELLAKKYVS